MNHITTMISMKAKNVVICFDFIIFVWWITSCKLNGIISTGCDLLWFYYFCVMNHIPCGWTIKTNLLWFALILLFLCDESHQSTNNVRRIISCDLLWFYYFCVMNHIKTLPTVCIGFVVICFDFIIFVWWITSVHTDTLYKYSCDLLWFYYFCVMNHIIGSGYGDLSRVVICFDFIIFVWWITSVYGDWIDTGWLWFALILLFLCDESHLAIIFVIISAVVICFDFIIFVWWITSQSW